MAEQDVEKENTRFLSTEDRGRAIQKICYIAPDVPIPSPRGSSVHVREVAKALASHGHEVHVICRRINGNEPKIQYLDGFILHRVYRFVIFPGSKVVGSAGSSASETRHGLSSTVYQMYLRSFFSFYVSLVASRIISKNKIDAIIERETSFGAGGLASVFTRKPLVMEIVGPRYSRLSVWRSKRVLYYTSSMLRKWVDRNKCLEVSGGVNISLFREDKKIRKDLREKLGFNPSQCVIGYIGTFQDWHGIDTLLHAMKRLHSTYNYARALLVGPFFEKYDELANDLGLEDVCTFTGPVEYEKVAEYINACDIMVALYEPARNLLRSHFGIGSPLKILEYMACGKPVISTNVAPVDKILENGISGYLVKPGDAEGLVLAISGLIEDESKANSLGSNGKKNVETHFLWSTLVNSIENILNEG